MAWTSTNRRTSFHAIFSCKNEKATLSWEHERSNRTEQKRHFTMGSGWRDVMGCDQIHVILWVMESKESNMFTYNRYGMNCTRITITAWNIQFSHLCIWRNKAFSLKHHRCIGVWILYTYTIANAWKEISQNENAMIIMSLLVYSFVYWWSKYEMQNCIPCTDRTNRTRKSWIVIDLSVDFLIQIPVRLN